jgi:predicted nucleic acid-binding protein
MLPERATLTEADGSHIPPVAIEALVAARAMPDRPIPDALILYAARAARSLPVYTFDRGIGRYGIPVTQP